MSASPAYTLDLPTEAVTYSTSEIKHAVQVESLGKEHLVKGGGPLRRQLE
jgi:hypothetical protein